VDAAALEDARATTTRDRDAHRARRALLGRGDGDGATRAAADMPSARARSVREPRDADRIFCERFLTGAWRDPVRGAVAAHCRRAAPLG
jgi:hypothetical protein